MKGKTKTRIQIKTIDGNVYRGRWNFNKEKIWVYDHYSGTEKTPGKLKFKIEFELPTNDIVEIDYIKKRIVCPRCYYINEYKTKRPKYCKNCGYVLVV